MKFTRITIKAKQMDGVPCIRGLRIPVVTVVGMAAEGMTDDEILKAYPDLEQEDICEALKYAAEAIQECEKKVMSSDFVGSKYPDYSRAYREAINFYEEQLKSITGVDGKDNNEIMQKLTLLQFCLICRHDLISIYWLLSKKEFFTPQLLLRNMVEHLITWAYIDKDPRKRVEQYVAQALRQQKIQIEKLQKHHDRTDLDLSNLVSREQEIKNQYDEYKNEIKGWPKTIEQMAEMAGVLYIYDILYRGLSINSHPNSFNAGHFFKDLPNGKIMVHPYGRDRTTLVMGLSLEIANQFMTLLNERFNLPSRTEYDRLDKVFKNL